MVTIGIDLGTTNTCVAVWRNNSVEVIPNEAGNRLTPSYVAFTKTERLIGESAKNQVSNNTANTIFGVKRFLGRQFDDIVLQKDIKRYPFKIINCNGKPKIVIKHKGNKRTYSPEEICAMIIYRMKEMAESYLSVKVEKAVLTVPAYFGDAQRQAIKLAGSIAGLEVIRIINEPTSAAVAYGLNRRLTGKRNILVYDLGGGTFNVSVLSIGNSCLYEVRAVAGNLGLGGEDFDNRLVAHSLEDIRKRYGIDIESPKNLLCLKSAAETTKRSLTSARDAILQIESFCNGNDYYCRVSRTLFEKLCSDLFEDTLKLVGDVLSEARMLKHNIHDVVLVGGSTRIPKIRKMLTEYFDGKHLMVLNNPDEAIATGAAVQAAILTGLCNDNLKRLLLIDVLPLSLGVETARGLMFKVVERNTPIPCRQTKEITTLEDFQTTMTIEVFEGERTLTKDNRLLGVFELNKIPPVPRGIAKIDIIFEIDSDSILTVSARDRSTGNSESITIKNMNKLSKDEVQTMIDDAKKFREEDDENKSRLEVRNQLETYIYDVKTTVTENLDKLSGEECAHMIGECVNALTWIDENPDCLREEYERKMSELLIRWSSFLRKIRGHVVKRQRSELYSSDGEDNGTTVEEIHEEK
ncbi:heat shock protein 68-like [Aricia agestis]|uniref:heat shock protein 68-like n=1 Tax=Aricia agestis TaxID=91739 RepID=UPI001C206111|nr:heat shock protein 68-like [Aricia agestis]